MTYDPIGTVMRSGPVIAVVTIDDVCDAVPLAGALVAGGLRTIEVTLRTAAAVEAIQRIAASGCGAIAGAGTVLSPADMQKAREAGAQFAVSPGLTAPLLEVATSMDLPFLPGIASASNIMRGLEAGLSHFKFFPAEAIGGVAALEALTGPFPHCRFCPTGGIAPANAAKYLELNSVLCVGGSWVAPRAALAAKNWSYVTELARAAGALHAGHC